MRNKALITMLLLFICAVLLDGDTQTKASPMISDKSSIKPEELVQIIKTDKSESKGLNNTGISLETINNNTESPLINAGCPEIDGEPQYDPDGTPPDIGAVYYPHHTKKYFERYNPSGIYWLSFPVVDDRTNTNGDDYWNELGQMFSEHMLYAPNSNLIDIGWSYNLDAGVFKYNGSEWDHLEHPVSQPKGYKVQFNDWVSNCAVVVDGFKADPNTTPVAWAVKNAEDLPFKNWVGYFVNSTQRAGDALSRYLPGSNRYRYIDYVHTIKTQTWSTCRVNAQMGSPWIINPNTYTLREGDMLSLLLIPGAPEEMYWLCPSGSVPPIEKPRATAFEYTEKLDYTPVYLQFDPQNMPTEVGLYVNGECKGAAVVDSTLIDVCLYTDDAKDGGELEIVFYHEGKGKKAVQGWKTYNHDSMVFEDTGLRTDQIGRYAYLSFSNKEGDSPVPLVTCLSQNYPNPFNPETNISFVLAKDMSARLDIYNVRGQKVSTLCNSELTKGKHTLQWNGRDAQGRKVASGIYFSRLQTPDGSFSQKMMLMK
ncbi:MAG TPA: T9SS type A sorting domain-containing protein [Candidatus Cloacimonadota bacterium]|nr:T9SS type A sorting domain-containing protein [Candidatus Cloacimonadota bacterium]